MRRSAIALFILLSSLPAWAQDTPAPDPQQPPAAVGETGTKPIHGFAGSLFHNLGDDVKHMPRKNSLYWLAAGTGLALAVHPDDNVINRHLATSRSANYLFKPGSIIGQGYFILPAAAAVYIFGRTEHENRVAHLGMDEIEAGLLAEGIVETTKEVARRQRPLRADGTRAAGFSFPSGHSTLTFAAATVLQQHLGYKAGIPTYIVATYVAMSRLHDNVHFASDVAFGAGLGILIGRAVTWHGRNFYGSPMVVNKGAGIMISVHDAHALLHP